MMDLPHRKMSQDEAADLYRRAMAGDISARNAIVEANLGLAGNFCRRFGKVYRHLSPEEVVSLACLGLVQAASRFDPSVAQFSTYAFQWMRCCVARGNAKQGARCGEPIHMIQSGDNGAYLRRLKKPGSKRALTRHLQRRWEHEGLELIATPPPDHERAGEIEDAERDCRSLPWHTLSKRETEVVRLYFGMDPSAPGGLALREVAARLGISKQRTHQLLTTARNKLSAEPTPRRQPLTSGGAA